MTLDLTGGLLVAFLLSELRPILARHPRYRENAGEVFQTFSNLITFRDVSVTVGNLRGDSTRLSPDYYVATAWGRALVAQVNGKGGTFIEWISEIDQSGQTPAPGMYLLAVDSVNEQTRACRFVLQATRSMAGCVKNADGTVIVVRPGIPLSLVQPTDPSIQLERAGTKMWLTQFTAALDLVRTDTGATLVPGTDWWLQRTVTLPLGLTAGGAQLFTAPDTMANLAVLDGNGIPLRQGIDWKFVSGGQLALAAWTPAGAAYSLTGTMPLDPTSNPLINPENQLGFALGASETLLPASVTYESPAGNFTSSDTVTGPDGAIYIKDLLTPGDDLRWSAQAGSPQTYVTANKMAMTANLVPGLNIAIGDLVEKDDQCAILVAPTATEVFKIFGGKDNVSFDITVKTNDLTTSSELASMVKRYLLVEGRSRMESAGITIHTAPYAYGGEQRDASGTATSHPVVLNISASADWEFYKPLVNAISFVDLALTVSEGVIRPGAKMAGRTQFVTSYF